MTYKTPELAAKAYAKPRGIVGRKGGWLYKPDGEPTCQGWGALAHRLQMAGIIRLVDPGDYSKGYVLRDLTRV